MSIAAAVYTTAAIATAATYKKLKRLSHEMDIIQRLNQPL
jgi:hypothetical protein